MLAVASNGLKFVCSPRVKYFPLNARARGRTGHGRESCGALQPAPRVMRCSLDDRREHKLRLQVCFPRHVDTEIFMSSKLLASALLATSLLAAPAIAFAQTSPPPDSTGPSGEATTAPRAMPMHHHAMRHHMAHRTHFGAGTTTGMSSRPGRATSRKPPAS